MGIKQTKNLPSGYNADYGRILSLDCLHVDGMRIDAVVGWYKDQEARDAGAQPAESERVSVQLTGKEVDAILKVVYKAEGFRALHPEAEEVLEEEDEATEAPAEAEAPEGEEIKPSKETEQNDPVD